MVVIKKEPNWDAHMNKNLLSVVHIQKIFKSKAAEVTILHDITITFMPGASYAITGISGSGKSTLLSIIAGFEPPTKGSIFYNERPIDIFTPQERIHFLQRAVGFLFQKPYFIKELSVFENIMLPGIVAGMEHDMARKRADELLGIVGLAAYAAVKPGVLSGGQQQRLCLARALFNKPHFLLADEPTAGLDAGHRSTIIELMQYGMEQWGMGIIVSTHDAVVAEAMQQVLLLQDGVLTLV
jgi:ABC-type lipoprotein export system ATPase subunit